MSARPRRGPGPVPVGTLGAAEPDQPEVPADIDDPQRLAREAREQIDKQAADIHKQRVPIETEPPTTYRPSRIRERSSRSGRPRRIRGGRGP